MHLQYIQSRYKYFACIISIDNQVMSTKFQFITKKIEKTKTKNKPEIAEIEES